MPNVFILFNSSQGNVTASTYTSASLDSVNSHIRVREHDTDLYHYSGSWQGLMRNLGVMTGSRPQILSASTFSSGRSQGNVPEVFEVDHDADNVTSDTYPNVLEGSNVLQWNLYPIPEVTDDLPARDRDATRYHKAYSFARSQPVRFRIVRRG